MMYDNNNKWLIQFAIVVVGFVVGSFVVGWIRDMQIQKKIVDKATAANTDTGIEIGPAPSALARQLSARIKAAKAMENKEVSTGYAGGNV